jgi:transcriptional regulator with XRE-family HTH domain
MEAIPITQGALARKLGVSEGAVSQMLNNPQNLTLKTIVAYARALGIKVSLVAYDDNDPLNERGPVNSEIFSICWENAGKPPDFWSLQEGLRVVSTEQIFNAPIGFYFLQGIGWQYAAPEFYRIFNEGTGAGSLVGMQYMNIAVPVSPQPSTKGSDEAHA